MRCVDEGTISVQVSWNKRGLSREETSEAVRDCEGEWVVVLCAAGDDGGTTRRISNRAHCMTCNK